MAVHKLMDWDLEEESYVLIAIHTTVEPYRIAYLINKHLKLGFQRTEKDQDIHQSAFNAQYPVYKYFDQQQNAPFYLTPNKFWGISNEKAPALGLFDQEEVTTVKTVLIKEFSSADYLLKIEKEEEYFPVKKLLNALGEIPQIISVYPIDSFQIKQQDYLIFD